VIEQKLTFRSVSIVAIAKNLSVYSRSRTLDNSTNSLETMKKTVGELFERFLIENPVEIRRVGVKLSGFSSMEKNQKQITSFLGSSQQ
jgi:nucleotidyltransferase/DNA polymerase involved in DNA repair